MGFTIIIARRQQSCHKKQYFRYCHDKVKYTEKRNIQNECRLTCAACQSASFCLLKKVSKVFTTHTERTIIQSRRFRGVWKFLNVIIFQGHREHAFNKLFCYFFIIRCKWRCLSAATRVSRMHLEAFQSYIEIIAYLRALRKFFLIF